MTLSGPIRKLWESRSSRERALVAALLVLLGAGLYLALAQSAERARLKLRASVITLQAQAARLEQQAAEIDRLRAVPAGADSRGDLRSLLQAQAEAAGLSRALLRIEARDANQAQVVFGAVPFADWLTWVTGLQLQRVRIDTCRIEALSEPGLVSVTATFVRSQPQ